MAGFFDDESGQFPGCKSVSGFFHAFLQGFQEHHIADDDSEGMGGIDAGILGGSKDAFLQFLHRLVQVRVLAALFGKFDEKPFYSVLLLFVHDGLFC